MPEHLLDYEIKINFNKDGVFISSTGEGINPPELKEGAILRHKHTKLLNSINDLIRQYIKDNH